MLVRSYAKINLALKVINKLENSQHTLDMVLVPIQLRDSIDITLLPPHFDTHIICQDFDLGSDEFNTCRLAVNKLRERFKFKQNFLIKIYKKIPTNSGLGGGSSNAAAVILELVKQLKLKVTQKELIEIGLEIGSDVPFFLLGKAARVQGVGEIIAPIKIKSKYTILIIKPKNGLTKKAVYRRFDEDNPIIQTLSEDRRIDSLIEGLRLGQQEVIHENLFNDLKSSAINLVPEIQQIFDLLHKDQFKNIQMSGSGTAVYALVPGDIDLSRYVDKYSKLGYQVIATNTRE